MLPESGILKIAVIGPESTGKSSLCRRLAEDFDAYHTEEYARTYLEERNGHYTNDDLLEMAKGQCREEKSISEKIQNESIGKKKTPLLFCDTDLHVIRIWSEIVFGNCNNRILDLIALQHYDHYLLCAPDIAWVYDALREHPDPSMRIKIFNHYKDMLIHQSTTWTLIEGSYDLRMNEAKSVVEELMKK